MTQTLDLPAMLAVRNMLEDLLGRDVTVSPADPITVKDVPTTVVALYTDTSHQLSAVLGLELTLAAYAAAALGLMPAGGAEDSIKDKHLSPMLAENVRELCNILTGLLNKEGGPRLKLDKVVLPGEPVPPDAQAHLLALGRRLDVNADVARYGDGKLTVVLVG